METPTAISEDKRVKSRRKLLLGSASSVALVAWHKPIINAVVTPAHAQTSAPLTPTAQDVCPMITTGNVTTGPVSGTTTPPVCTATFDILSSDASADLTISAIDPGTLPANVTIDIQDLGVANTSTGPRVVWRGPASDAPFCTDLMPTEEVTFTVTATCAAATAGDSFTQTFTLTSIITP